MAFEKVVPQWNAAGSEPPQTLKDEGFSVGYKPPADYFNWFWHGVSEALTELQIKTPENGSKLALDTDLDTVIVSGFYRFDSAVNSPKRKDGSVVNYSQLLVLHAVGDTIAQIVVDYLTGSMYVRAGSPTVVGGKATDWQGWFEVYTSGNLPPFDFAAIGINPVTVSTDTVSAWAEKGAGYAVFNETGHVTDQPSSYGFLINYVNGNNAFQLWSSQTDGPIYYRSGNANGWDGTWRQLYDSEHLPTPDDIMAFSRGYHSGDMNELLLPGQYRLNRNSNLPEDAYYGQAFVGRGDVTGANKDTLFQIVGSYNKAKMWFRGARYVSDTDSWTFEEWSEIYSSQNPPFTYGMEDMTAGTSTLATGKLYFVFE